MNHLTKAYWAFFIYFIFSTAITLVGLSENLTSVIWFILAFITLIITSKFVSQDAVANGLSKKNGYWCLLGIFGIFSYHIFITKKTNTLQKIIIGLVSIIVLLSMASPLLLQSGMFIFSEEQCDLIYPVDLTQRNTNDLVESMQKNTECKEKFADQTYVVKECEELEYAYREICYFNKAVSEKNRNYCNVHEADNACVLDLALALSDRSICTGSQVEVACVNYFDKCTSGESNCSLSITNSCLQYDIINQPDKRAECDALFG